MDEKQKAEQEAATAAAKKAEEDAAKKAADDAAKSPQDPLKAEADKIKKEKEGRTELEKAIYSYQKTGRTQSAIRQRIVDLGGDPDSLDGAMTPKTDEDDEAPVTVGMLKKIEQDKAAKTALNLANEQIQDETERTLVIHHLENTIKPSGNAVVDLANARAIVNETKNRMVAEEATRRTQPNRHSKGSGAAGKGSEGIFEPTAEEITYMRPPFNLTKEKILDARKKVADAQK